MQNMQKEIETQGAKEKELFDKFMCFCNGNNGDLAAAAEKAKSSIEELTAKISSETAEKNQMAIDLVEHKKDVAGAQADLAQATTLREKEKAEFAANKADSETNIAAMAGAIPALEKGMGGSSFMQIPHAERIKKLFIKNTNIDAEERREVLNFIQHTGDYVPQSGQIVGILKGMKDEMEKDLDDAIKDEEDAVASYADLKASKEKEAESAMEAIETKTKRSGELALSLVDAKDGLENAEEELKDTKAFLAQLEEQCATKEKEWAERQKTRGEEISAISDAIGILNDDDSLDVFKKAMPSSLIQGADIGFLQKKGSKASLLHRVQAMLATAAKYPNSHFKALLFTVQSKLKLKRATQDFGEVIKMIDDMVALLGKDQKEDDKQKAWCSDEFEKSGDEEKQKKSALSALEAAVSEMTDEIAATAEEIDALGAGIKDLDKAVAEATEQRKQEHAEYVETTKLTEVAMGLIEKAKKRLEKFYAFIQAKKEAEEDDAEFVQVRMHRSRVAPPPAPETFEGGYKKSEKSAGVLGLMDMILRELGTDKKDAEYEEKTAQKDYAALMTESTTTRNQDAKSITDKGAAKATLEGKLEEAKEKKVMTSDELSTISTYIQDLHVSCDFLMQNYDLREEARANEVDGLKNAKATLAGAGFA